jgi:aspartate kinase
VVAGFQGITDGMDITTWAGGARHHSGRACGGAGADIAEIHRCERVNTCDPNINNQARRLERISYDEMLEDGPLGPRFSRRSPSCRKRNTTGPILVKNTFSDQGGTRHP